MTRTRIALLGSAACAIALIGMGGATALAAASPSPAPSTKAALRHPGATKLTPAQRDAKQAERLAKAVSDGKLTQAQADHITSVMKDVANIRATVTDKAAARDQVKAKLTGLRQWAKDNNLPTRLAGHAMGRLHARTTSAQ